MKAIKFFLSVPSFLLLVFIIIFSLINLHLSTFLSAVPAMLLSLIGFCVGLTKCLAIGHSRCVHFFQLLENGEEEINNPLNLDTGREYLHMLYDLFCGICLLLNFPGIFWSLYYSFYLRPDVYITIEYWRMALTGILCLLAVLLFTYILIDKEVSKLLTSQNRQASEKPTTSPQTH